MLVSRAAVAEEVLFRGYPIERLEQLTGSRLLAAAISWTAFTVAHHRLWGWNYLIEAGFLGVILTFLYLWRRNLPSNMIAHWIANVRMLLL
jgi:membrane protease YdiL (CAAX protease family)